MEFLYITLLAIIIVGLLMTILVPFIINKGIKYFYKSSFYYQRQIEGQSKCTKQCEHCKSYYNILKPDYPSQ